MTIHELVEAFLGWCARHRQPKTHLFYVSRLKGFRAAFGPLEAVAQTSLGIDEYLHLQRDHGAARGGAIGVAYAEGFRQYRGHPYPSDNRLLKLLGQNGRGG